MDSEINVGPLLRSSKLTFNDKMGILRTLSGRSKLLFDLNRDVVDNYSLTGTDKRVVLEVLLEEAI